MKKGIYSGDESRVLKRSERIEPSFFIWGSSEREFHTLFRFRLRLSESNVSQSNGKIIIYRGLGLIKSLVKSGTYANS